MEFRFNAEEWAAMTPKQRMKRCAILAEEADKLAAGANKRFKPLYLEIAAQWQDLAKEISAAMRGPISQADSESWPGCSSPVASSGARSEA